MTGSGRVPATPAKVERSLFADEPRTVGIRYVLAAMEFDAPGTGTPAGREARAAVGGPRRRLREPSGIKASRCPEPTVRTAERAAGAAGVTGTASKSADEAGLVRSAGTSRLQATWQGAGRLPPEGSSALPCAHRLRRRTRSASGERRASPKPFPPPQRCVRCRRRPCGGGTEASGRSESSGARIGTRTPNRRTSRVRRDALA